MLSCIDDPCLNQLLYYELQNGDIFHLIISSTSWYFCLGGKKSLSISPLAPSLYQYVFTDLFAHVLWSLLFIFILKLSPIWPPGGPSIQFLCPFDMTSSVFWALPTTWLTDTTRHPMLTLYIPRPIPGINHFFKEPFSWEWYLKTKSWVLCGVYCH